MEERNSVTIKDVEHIGQVKIADEVVAIIANLAAEEIEGVKGIGGIPTNKKNKRNFTKGVSIDIVDNEVICDVIIGVDYGIKIKDVAQQVQERVKSAIETMTGLNVREVNVSITSIHMLK